MQLSRIITELCLLAEKSANPSEAVRVRAEEQHLPSSVTWMLATSLPHEANEKEMRAACLALLRNHDQPEPASFWKAWAELRLGRLEAASEYVDSRVIGNPDDRSFMQRNIKAAKLEQAGMTPEIWAKFGRLIQVCSDNGDFNTPRLAWLAVTQQPKTNRETMNFNVLGMHRYLEQQQHEENCYFSNVQWKLFEAACRPFLSPPG
ncbi:TPA: hypothetical protein DEP96_03725 [Candidatus Uhrbacteria bacterium]|nr:hypothetical protein [Candidatus Uhrbacteria bacterium]